ncbi:Uncharacterized protein Adt_40969 [Abeliophyllum distichum]|uniref:Uncharacterized protein n=1 Tax=Abeliophyllum distichum TaxID=126358 RepID=A0ABD1PMI4_9LAMI
MLKLLLPEVGFNYQRSYVMRSVANKEMVPSTEEEHVEQTEQTTAMKESSGTPQVKATVPIKAYDPPIPISSEVTKSTRASINLMPLSIFRKLGLEEAKATTFMKISISYNPSDPLEACIVHSQSSHADSSEVEMCARYLEANPPYTRRPQL